MSNFLLLDVSHLAYRAHYTVGGLSYRGNPTGVIYGVLRDVVSLQRDYGDSQFVFAFDSKHNLRKEEFPWYKANRNKIDKQTLDTIHGQIKRLRKDILPELGFANLLQQRGYEADDIIASVAGSIPRPNQVVIVSGDHDLYQCLRENVVQLLKKGTMTEKELKKTFSGITPHQWRIVKAVAGCTSDNIEGVSGVGEITAAKWCREKLPDGPLKERIVDFVRTNKFSVNLQIVSLPYIGIKQPKLLEDRRPSNWGPVLRSLGIESLEPEVTGDTSLRKGIKRHDK